MFEQTLAGRDNGAAPPQSARAEAGYAALKQRIHQRLIEELDPIKVQSRPADETRKDIEEAVNQLMMSDGVALPRPIRLNLIAEISDEILGLGPLEPLLKDSTVSEIMVNTPDEVYVERGGILELTEVRFRDNAHILTIIERIIGPLNRRLDESSPMVDARLESGARVNAIIPPLSLRGPTLTIRKFANERLTLQDMVRIGSISAQVADFLKACVVARLNMLISGGTGTGKTTMLNAISEFIPSGERIVTIEDPAELELKRRHTIRLETRPANIEGKNQITQRQLLVNALRMRPDRIIIGEVRAGEAFDMLQAMNTGHEGSVCTVHANSPRDALARVENMVLMANLDLPVRAIREQLASAIHLVVHVARMRDGVRRVVHVSEVAGMEEQTITMQEIFTFEQRGIGKNGEILGQLVPTGLRPAFADLMIDAGVDISPSLFLRPGGWQAWQR